MLSQMVVQTRGVAGVGLAFSFIGAAAETYNTVDNARESWSAFQFAINSLPNAKADYENHWPTFWQRRNAILKANADCKEKKRYKLLKQPHSGNPNPGNGNDTTPATSMDPNAKLTVGKGNQGLIALGTPLLYTIEFVNEVTATLPAQAVIISDALSSQLGWSSVQLVEIGFNNTVIAVPTGLNQYQATTQVSTDPNPVSINAALNPQTGVLTWQMQSIDSVTGGVPADPLAGFLPPDNAQHQGEGYVIFSVKPKASLSNGAKINNQARIVFAVNPLIDTDVASTRSAQTVTRCTCH